MKSSQCQVYAIRYRRFKSLKCLLLLSGKASTAKFVQSRRPKHVTEATYQPTPSDEENTTAYLENLT